MPGSEDDNNSYPPLWENLEEEDSVDETLVAIIHARADAVAVHNLDDAMPPTAAAAAFIHHSAAQHAIPLVVAAYAAAAAPNPREHGAGGRAGALGGRGGRGGGL